MGSPFLFEKGNPCLLEKGKAQATRARRAANSVAQSSERKCTRPGSNWQPSACWADVIATRPRVPRVHAESVSFPRLRSESKFRALGRTRKARLVEAGGSRSINTPCGTRTHNLRIRGPTPCPLGQGGLTSCSHLRTLLA